MIRAVIITAAGRGTRAGGELPQSNGRCWAANRCCSTRLMRFRAMHGFSKIIVTIHPDDQARAATLGPDVQRVIRRRNPRQIC